MSAHVKDPRGFTLLEVVAVMLMIGILIISGLPFCRSELANINLLQAADLMTEEIRGVQQKAMTEGSSLYTLQYYDHKSFYLLKEGNRQLAELRLPRGVQVYNTNLNKGCLMFYSSGQIGSGGTIVLEDPDAGRRIDVIVVPVTGRVRIDLVGM